MLGCVGYVINLAAKAGMKALEKSIPGDESDELPQSDLNFDERDDEDCLELDETLAGSPVHRIEKFVAAVQRSPQKASTFQAMIQAAYPNDLNLHSLSLVRDVSPR